METKDIIAIGFAVWLVTGLVAGRIWVEWLEPENPIPAQFRDQRSGLYTFRRNEIVYALTDFVLKELRGNGGEGMTICRRCGAEHRDGVMNVCCM